MYALLRFIDTPLIEETRRMDTRMDYGQDEENISFDLISGLQQIQDDCLNTADIGLFGQQQGHGLPLPAPPVHLIGRTAVMSQASIPQAVDVGLVEERGVKRKYCPSNSDSLTSSAERQAIMKLNLFDSSGSFPDAGCLTEDDFNAQIVVSPREALSISSASTDSTMQHSPNLWPVSTMQQSPDVRTPMEGNSPTVQTVQHSPEVWQTMVEDHRPASVTDINDSATRTEQTVQEEETTDSNQGLPSDCKLELKVGYNYSTLQKTLPIDKPDGFLLFHEKTPDPNKLPKDCKFIRFPNLDGEDEGVGMRETAPPLLGEKQQKYIERILQNMWGGLQVRCHGGCIYATRWSKAKIYYKSYETRCTGNEEEGPMADVKELPRGKEVLVLNHLLFQNRIRVEYLDTLSSQESGSRVDPSVQAKRDNALAQDMNPTIYFSFAQKWAPECHPLKNCLVWAQLKPCRALFEYEGLFHTKHKSLDSFSSNLLQMSMDAMSLDSPQVIQTHRES